MKIVISIIYRRCIKILSLMSNSSLQKLLQPHLLSKTQVYAFKNVYSSRVCEPSSRKCIEIKCLDIGGVKGADNFGYYIMRKRRDFYRSGYIVNIVNHCYNGLDYSSNETRHIYRILVGKPLRKRLLGRPRQRSEKNIKI
jgi:hypothetical protein